MGGEIHSAWEPEDLPYPASPPPIKTKDFVHLNPMNLQIYVWMSWVPMSSFSMDVTVFFQAARRTGAVGNIQATNNSPKSSWQWATAKKKGRPAVGSREETKMSELNGRQQAR